MPRHGEASHADGQNNRDPLHLGEFGILESQKEPLVDGGQQALHCELEMFGIGQEDNLSEDRVRIGDHVGGLGHRPATRRGRPHFQAPSKGESGVIWEEERCVSVRV